MSTSARAKWSALWYSQLNSYDLERYRNLQLPNTRKRRTEQKEEDARGYDKLMCIEASAAQSSASPMVTGSGAFMSE